MNKNWGEASRILPLPITIGAPAHLSIAGCTQRDGAPAIGLNWFHVRNFLTVTPAP